MPAQLRTNDRAAVTRLVAVLLVAMTTVIVPGRPASASCVEVPDLESGYESAEVVFIGRVVELTNLNRTATVELEEVWKGPEMPAVVTVNGGPDEQDVQTSVDRDFELGTYVFFPLNQSPPFQDNACTLTQRTTSALDAIAPNREEPAEKGDAGQVVTTSAAQPSAAAQGASTESVGEPTTQSSETGSQGWAVGGGLAVLISAFILWRGFESRSSRR